MQRNIKLYDMKNMALTLAFALACGTAYGQSYATMWKTFDKSIEKDLPKTALQHSQAIYAKASAENNTGQMLKAALVTLQLNGTISPDSGDVYLARFDSMAKREERPVVKAMMNLALARLHADRQRYDDPAKGDMALACYAAATADLSIFEGHKTSEFIPATIIKNDSRYFGHDLLAFVCREAVLGIANVNYSSTDADSVAAMRRNLSHRFIEHYRAAGNGNAVVLATVDSLEREGALFITHEGQTDSSSYKVARQLIEQYDGNTCAVEAYIYACQWLRNKTKGRKECLELARLGAKKYASSSRSYTLRNIAYGLTRPECTAMANKRQVYEGQSLTIKLQALNVQKAQITFYHLPMPPSAQDLQYMDYSHLRKKVSGAAFTVTKALDRKNEYDTITDSITVTFKQKGVYLARLTTDKNTKADYWPVYVSNLKLVSLPVPSSNNRLTVVDAKTGHPVPGAKVDEYKYDGKKRKLTATYTANDRGEVIISGNSGRYRGKFFPYTKDDKYSEGISYLNIIDYSQNNINRSTEARLYTDRAIYRPGQEVHVGGIVYNREGDSFNTLYDQKITLKLLDAKAKEIATKEVTSDEFGAFGADFELPQSCLPGRFRISAKGFADTGFSVEEYKRPTFEVEVSKPDVAYNLGDTVSAKGTAITYTGIGVAGARVTYEVNCNMRPWIVSRNAANAIFRDTTTTDDKGNFTIRIPLTPAEQNGPVFRNIARYFTANVTVTSPDGESQNATSNVTVGKEPAILACDLPGLINKSNVPRVTFSLDNASGTPLDGKGEYIIYKGKEKVAAAEFEANKAVEIPALRQLPSGKYLLEAEVPGVTDSTSALRFNFMLFALDDKRPADSTEIWTYATSDVLPRDSDITVQIGTSMRDVVAFYDVIGNGKLLESRQIPMSDTIINLKYRYKEEYGDGVAITLGFMRDGVLYSNVRQLQKPEPAKRLRFKWTTFRNRLQPGAAEEWSLTVYEPDGNPAKASAIAALYDASLDKFAKNYWNASLGFYRIVPVGSWATGNYSMRLNSLYPSGYHTEFALQFDEFDDKLFTPYYSMPKAYSTRSNVEVKSIRSSIKFNNKVTMASAMAKDLNLAADESSAVIGAKRLSGISVADVGGSAEYGEEAIPEVKVRENFAETAFFMPALRTDDNGHIAIAFTVPESMTKWNFKLLAHTKDMNIGLLDTTTVVAKDFMVQPNMPRYLRKGDKAVVSATVRNVTANVLSGTAYLVLQDAATEAVIEKLSEKFSVSGNAQAVVRFKFNAPEDCPLLICKVMADAGTFADGEQHYLPVLTDETENIQALPFTITGKGSHTIDLAPLLSGNSRNARNNRLTIEYTANPLWYAVQALPDIAEPKEKDAVSIASAFYATTLEQTIARLSPALAKAAEQWATEQSEDTLVENALLRNEGLKNIVFNETPWVAEGNSEGSRRRKLARAFDYGASSARARNLLERLTLLQQNDGGWSWFPGMQSNYYITGRVLDMLVRLEEITGDKAAANLVAKGISYLDKDVAERIERMKGLGSGTPKINIDNSDLLTYLDILRRSNCELSSTARANRRYLIGKLAKEPVLSNMYNKALSAVILMEAGHKDEARTALQSLMEHTVSKPGMGRYFDTDRATLTWESYKIPTQVAAIEAVRLITPDDTETLQQMLTWLIQAKRTQSWSNERNTVDAVYALLLQADSTSGMFHFDTTLPESARLTFKNGNTSDIVENGAQAAGTLGYIRRDYGLDTIKAKPVSVTIEKNDDGISWGGVYYRSLVPATEVKSGKGELTVERTYLVAKDGKYVPMSKNDTPKTGDRIRVDYTITAARDFDFVSLQDARPACLEPVKQMSGYTWNDGEAYYYAAGDTKQGFFFERMSKGEHKLSCDYIVDRAGKYLVGTASVQCLYSPEFAGTSKGFMITTE